MKFALGWIYVFFVLFHAAVATGRQFTGRTEFELFLFVFVAPLLVVLVFWLLNQLLEKVKID